MYTVKTSLGMSRNLLLILQNIAPNKLPTLKVMDLVSKTYEKFGVAAQSLLALEAKIDDEKKALEATFKGLTNEEAKQGLTKEANARLLPLLKEREELQEQAVEVELSDEQIEWVRKNFKVCIADSFTSIKAALDAATAFEIVLEEEV